MKVKNIGELRLLKGKELEPSPWLHITQPLIDAFAKATYDEQWIHVDVEKARKNSPFKKTVAHGFLSVALLSHMLKDVLTMESTAMGVNYGFDKIRFPSPVLVNSRVRLKARIIQLEDYQINGIKITWDCVVEIENSEKPACIAEWITLLFE